MWLISMAMPAEVVEDVCVLLNVEPPNVDPPRVLPPNENALVCVDGGAVVVLPKEKVGFDEAGWFRDEAKRPDILDICYDRVVIMVREQMFL
jgi:hypothetical protein